jgi:hypothetical protein
MEVAPIPLNDDPSQWISISVRLPNVLWLFTLGSGD